jgi:DNA-binding CsgD family transcriptional regulator
VQLSAAQAEILQKLADGDRYADVALATGRSEGTIKNIMHQLLQELGADNSRHAIAIGFRSGALK